MKKTLLKIGLCCVVGAAAALVGALVVSDETQEIESQDIIDESAK